MISSYVSAVDVARLCAQTAQDAIYVFAALCSEGSGRREARLSYGPPSLRDSTLDPFYDKFRSEVCSCGKSAAGTGVYDVNPLTGVFTYKPSTTARHDAAAVTATQDGTEVKFTINVSDAHGGVAPVEVTAPILSQNAPPSTLPANMYNKLITLTGVIVYTKTWADPDLDTPTYKVTTDPAHGAVLLDTDITLPPLLGGQHLLGVMTYTSSNLLFPAHDTFEITVSDRHGYSTVIPFSVFSGPHRSSSGEWQ